MKKKRKRRMEKERMTSHKSRTIDDKRHLMNAGAMLNMIMKTAALLCIVLMMAGPVCALKKPVFEGHVLDVRGHAVKGAEIYIYNSPDTRRPADFISSWTDAEGRFSVALSAGRYWTVARLRSGEKYGPLLPGDRHSGEPIEIIIKNGMFEQNYIVMDIREAGLLVKKTSDDFYQVSGKLIDRQGMPVSNLYLFANRGMQMEEIPDYLSAWTDEQGQYTLYLKAGKYYVGYASEFPPTLLNKVLIELNVEQDLTGFDITAYDTSQIGNDAQHAP